MTTPKSFPDEIERFLLAYYRWPEATFGFIWSRALFTFGAKAPDVDEVATFLCRTWRGKRFLNRFHRDQHAAEWLRDNRKSGTTAQIREHCIAEFGPDRTPPYGALERFLAGSGPRRHPPRRVASIRVAINPATATWIRQVARHMTISATLAALRARFPRVPIRSRSALHRFLQRRGIVTAGHQTLPAVHPELAAYLRTRARTHTLTQLRDAAVKRFGPKNASSRSAIHRMLQKQSLTGHKAAPGWPADVEVWVSEQRGTATLDRIRAACVARFGRDRSPSRSAIHRHLQRDRHAAP